MTISKSQLIRDETLDNLMTAHKRISAVGNVKDIKRLTKYLLRLSKQFNEILVDECEVTTRVRLRM